MIGVGEKRRAPARSARALELPSKESLGERSIRSAAVSAAGHAARFVLGLLGTVVLARLLAPSDFGLVAMVGAVVGLLGATKELGLSLATVQRERITHRQVSALFFANLTFGLALALATALLAPLIAWFYREPRLAAIAIALAAGFVVSGASVQHRALLQRRMRFGALAVVELGALAFGTAVAVTAAAQGLGYWALVALPLASGLANVALLWLVCPWRPGLPARAAEVRSLLVFGGHVAAADVMQHLSRNLDKVLIGWYWGAAPLGLYAKAYQLALLPIQQVNAPLARVAVPALSRLQLDPVRYRRFFLKTLRFVAFAGLPLLATIAVLSREIISIVLGEQWLAASPLLAVLAGAAFFQLIANTAGWIFVSLGHTGRMLRWTALASAAVILSFAIGLSWGPLGVATAYCVCVCALRYPHFAVALRGSPITMGDVFRCVCRPALLALVAALAMGLARGALLGTSPVVILLGAVAAGGVAWISAVAFSRGAREDAGELIALARRALGAIPVGRRRPAFSES